MRIKTKVRSLKCDYSGLSTHPTRENTFILLGTFRKVTKMSFFWIIFLLRNDLHIVKCMNLKCTYSSMSFVVLIEV